jgi:hypothetical protein
LASSPCHLRRQAVKGLRPIIVVAAAARVGIPCCFSAGSTTDGTPRPSCGCPSAARPSGSGEKGGVSSKCCMGGVPPPVSDSVFEMTLTAARHRPPQRCCRHRTAAPSPNEPDRKVDYPSYHTPPRRSGAPLHR